MKKLLAVLALALLASPAYATVAGTKHDLSNAGAEELCAYCHTPHAASTSVSTAPLWNRGVVNATSLYSTATLNAVITTNAMNETDAPLCLSCHAGGAMNAGILNPPNNGGLTNAFVITGSGLIDAATMNNDHPIGFDYTAAQAIDAEINGAPAITGISWGGAAGNLMQCSSCHDVHNNANAPFLLMANTGSDLCLACHIK